MQLRDLQLSVPGSPIHVRWGGRNAARVSKPHRERSNSYDLLQSSFKIARCAKTLSAVTLFRPESIDRKHLCSKLECFRRAQCQGLGQCAMYLFLFSFLCIKICDLLFLFFFCTRFIKRLHVCSIHTFKIF